MVRACLQTQAVSDSSLESTTDTRTVSHPQPRGANADLQHRKGEGICYDFQIESRELDPEAESRLLLGYLAQGDSSAFWRLWLRHQKYLYALCLRQMGGVQEDAEDALSRAMLKALEKLPYYAATISDVRAWLARLISNLCVDIHRERRRRTRGAVSLDEMLAADREPAPPSEKSPEDALLSREMLGYVSRAVEELPARLRQPFVLRFLQETAYREIAEQLAITTDNTRKRVQQARAILRARLDSYLVGLTAPAPVCDDAERRR